MKTIMLLGAIFIGSSAMAGTLNCEGSYFGHTFKVHGQTSATAVTGAIHLAVSGPFHNEEGDLQVSSSELRPGSYVRFAATANGSTANLDATFSSGQTYTGTLAVAGEGGSGNVPVTCTLGRPGDIED